MNPKIEDLRKKAFVLYEGPDGVQKVDQAVKKTGVSEDELKDEQLKLVLNRIIKNVFIDYVGLERTKEVLAKETLHVPGYHRTVEEKRGKIHILERINFTKWFVVAVVALLILVVAVAVYYTTTFQTVKLCDKKTDPAERDRCFLSLALSTANVTLCDKLSTQKATYNCYGSVGMKLNDTEICKRVPGEDIDLMAIHDKCIMCVAFNLNNESLCRSFMNPMKVAECETQLERGYSLVCPR